MDRGVANMKSARSLGGTSSGATSLTKLVALTQASSSSAKIRDMSLATGAM